MRSLIPLFLLAVFICVPVKLLGQNSGTLIGQVYVRIQNENTKTSLNYSVENKCKSEPCDRKAITSVELRYDDKYHDKSSLDGKRVLPNSKDTLSGDALKAYYADPSRYAWFVPGADNTLKISGKVDYAFSWGDEWKCRKEKEKKKTAIICEDKDPSTSEYDFYGRVDMGLKYDSFFKSKFELKANYRLDTVYEDEIKPSQLPELRIGDPIENCLKPPFVMHPGRDFYSGLSQQNLQRTWVNNYGNSNIPGSDGYVRTPVAYGAFVVKEGTGEIIWLDIPQLSAPSSNLLFIRTSLPAAVDPKDSIYLIGVNVFGESFLGSRLNDSVIRPYGGGCEGGMTQATKYVFEGRRLCVCGCFTKGDKLDIQDRLTVFTLDGKTITPSSLGPTTATFLIPEGTAPGLHKIGYTDPDDDRYILDEIDFRVLKLNGAIDQSALLRGESTTMRLQILGTEDKLPLRITNKTPKIIDITGGVMQTTPTSGGSDNKIERQVKGISPGNFAIDYSVDSAPCPCYASDF
ncbi:MAG: hypothetical protein R2681_03800 [Pyrinomonadaceae bacterium]